MSRHPLVSIVVLNWNRLAMTASCCRALEALDHPAFQTVVVDSGSSMNNRDDLCEVCPEALVVRLNENRGFAGGVNAGIRAAFEAGRPDYIWLVNNDILCEPGSLSRLLATAAQSAGIGLVGNPMEEGAIGQTRWVPAGKTLRPPFYVPLEVCPGERPDYLCGASLLIRRELIEQIGLLDEQFFFFFEDADYSRRALQAGWRLAVCPDAGMTHTGSATIGGMSEMLSEAYRAGHVRYVRKHVRHPVVSASLCFASRLWVDAVAGRGASLRGNWRGWRRGWAQRI